MIVLFVNLHKNDEEGVMKFNRYYNSITKILKQTIYYGTHYQEVIRSKENLSDFLFDEKELSQAEKEKEKFKSVTYVFIQGPLSLPPWSLALRSVSLLIRNCLKENKKVHFNGFGHIAAYYYLTTGFDKDYYIKRVNDHSSGKQDYFHEEESGDLYAHNKKVCTSGIKICRNSCRAFNSKSVQALQKGAILSTKFHYLAFNSKNGDSMIRNISFPFAFFEKSKVFCLPVVQTKANVTVLIETEDKLPLVYTHHNSLSTHLLCNETMKVLYNWLTNDSTTMSRQVDFTCQSSSEVAFNNMLATKSKFKTFTPGRTDSPEQVFTTSRMKQNTGKTLISRPQTAVSATKKKFDFQKPSLRCSGPYGTAEELQIASGVKNKSKIFGRSRMIFKTETQKFQISCYVQRTPSRPPSAHCFRDVNKSKWIDKKTFFVT